MTIPYKVLDFDAGCIPDGLQREHRLKAGVRGELLVTVGELVFLDGTGTGHCIRAGQTIAIEPEMPHRLEKVDGAAIRLSLFRI